MLERSSPQELSGPLIPWPGKEDVSWDRALRSKFELQRGFWYYKKLGEFYEGWLDEKEQIYFVPLVVCTCAFPRTVSLVFSRWPDDVSPFVAAPIRCVSGTG